MPDWHHHNRYSTAAFVAGCPQRRSKIKLTLRRSHQLLLVFATFTFAYFGLGTRTYRAWRVTAASTFGFTLPGKKDRQMVVAKSAAIEPTAANSRWEL